MSTFLKSHPFAVEAEFETTTVLTFAFPKQLLQDKIPSFLELDTYQNQWAFIAVAMVQTKHLRPKGFMRFLGHDFFLIGYRIFVRYTNKNGRRLRGLYILKSETDKSFMSVLGNIFTHYNYTTTDISCFKKNEQRIIKSERSKFEVIIDEAANTIKIPSDSPFSSWSDARKFSGPLPFTFSLTEKNQTLIIEGVREKWNPQPLHILSHHFDFFKTYNLPSPILAAAFEIKNVPYYWKKGIIENNNEKKSF